MGGGGLEKAYVSPGAAEVRVGGVYDFLCWRNIILVILLEKNDFNADSFY